MYKQSMFNYCTENAKGELLLFNSTLGEVSMCKIADPISKEEYLKKSIISNESIMAGLVARGLYVDTELDEVHKLHCIISSATNPSDLGITISLTEQCNFACVYCYENGALHQIDEITKNNIVSFVKDNIHKYSGLSVNWFGGEPLLALETIEEMTMTFLKICNFNRCRYSASITTNGYELSIDIFRRLISCKVFDYQITLDGIKFIHDRQRCLKNGEPTFDRIIHNLRSIKALKRRNFRIVLRSNLTQEILTHLDEYIDLMSELCSDDSRFNLSICFASVWSDNLGQNIKQSFIYDRDSVIPLYEKLIERNAKIYITSSITPEHGSCAYGKNNRFFIRPNGELHKCSVKFENPKNIVGKFVDGRIVCFDSYYSKIIDPRKCKQIEKCFYAPICKGETCPSSRTNGESVCPDSKKHLKYVLQIFDNNDQFVLLR